MKSNRTTIKNNEQEIAVVKEESATFNSLETREVEVLYQRMGEKWYAFSLVDDEIYLGALSPDDLGKIHHEKNYISKK